MEEFNRAREVAKVLGLERLRSTVWKACPSGVIMIDVDTNFSLALACYGARVVLLNEVGWLMCAN